MSFATTLKRAGLRRTYTQPATPPKSGHAQWYSDVVPAMVPIFLLGSAVYLVRGRLHTPDYRLMPENY